MYRGLLVFDKMKHSPLWVNLIKSDKRRNSIVWWNPQITDVFLNKLELQDREWKIPPVWDIPIFHYSDHYHHLNSKYTINRNWEIKSLKWKVMKYFFQPNKRWPRVRIQLERLDEKWKSIFIEKEIWVLQMMEKIFWSYFKWYKLKLEYPKDYILVPKDWNYYNMKYDNLIYVNKRDCNPTKKKIIADYLLLNIETDTDKLSKMFDTTPAYILKIKDELMQDWYLSKFASYQNLQTELWIEFNEESMLIYQILIECQWKLSNMEIVKILWPNEILKTKNKRFYTDKIVRVRKKMVDKWLIPRFNELFESKKEEAIEMINDKANSHKTNQEIADVLWLKKEQIDNLARQIKKKK